MPGEFAARAVALHNMVLPLGAGRSFPSLRPEPTTACVQAPLGPLGGWPSHVLPPALRTTVIYHTMARRSTRMNSHLSKEPGRALLALRTDAPGLELWTILGGSIPNERKLLFRNGRTKLFRTTGYSLRSHESALELTGMDVEDPLREESDVEATGTADAMHVVNPSQVESDVDSTEDVDVIVYRAPLGDFADW